MAGLTPGAVPFETVAKGREQWRGGRKRQSRLVTPFRNKLQVKSINVQGAPGIRRLIDAIASQEERADVWCLQEVRTTRDDWVAFQKQLMKFDYYGYLMEGEVTTGRYGRDQALGGLATLVHKSLRQKMRRQSRQGEAQVQFVEVQDWVVGNVYAPPRPHNRTCTLGPLAPGRAPVRRPRPSVLLWI